MRVLKAAALTVLAPFYGAIAQENKGDPSTLKEIFESTKGPESIVNAPKTIQFEFEYPDDNHCGTPIPLNADLILQQLDSFSTFGPGGSSIEGGTIRTVVHVMCSDDGTKCAATQQMVDDQMDILNAGFSSTGYSFLHVNTTYTNNSDWLYNDTEIDMKSTLAIDPVTTFNVYVVDLEDYLGYAYFPFMFPEDDFMHGAVIHGESLPGGNITDYNLGGTLVHEAGHYLGLFHTFEGGYNHTLDDDDGFEGPGCDGPGDFIDDTPAEGGPAWGCPHGRDSCPGHPGLDPISNYMDYSYDDCRDEFTEGQRIRMNEMISTFKPNLVTTTTSPDLVVLSNQANPGVCAALYSTGCSNDDGSLGNPQDLVNCFINNKTALPYQVNAVRFWLGTAIPPPKYLDVRIWSGSRANGPSSLMFEQSLPAQLILGEYGPITAYLDTPVEITEQEFCVGVFSGPTKYSGLTYDAVTIQFEASNGQEANSFREMPMCGIETFTRYGDKLCIEALVRESVSE
jgi:hypothetical protein